MIRDLSLLASGRRTASSLSDSTAHASCASFSSSVVRGWVSRLQVMALRVDTRQAFLRVRPAWDARDQSTEAGEIASVVAIDSLKGRLGR